MALRRDIPTRAHDDGRGPAYDAARGGWYPPAPADDSPQDTQPAETTAGRDVAR